MNYALFKKLAFKLDPELVHDIIVGNSCVNKSIPNLFFRDLGSEVSDFVDETSVGGLTFRHRLGIAAGFDKNGTALSLVKKMNASFLEVGTILPAKQIGNSKPRIFRHPDDCALTNCMGFPSFGVKVVKDNLSSYGRDASFRIGGNIGKLKDTPNEEAYKDYVRVAAEIIEVVDFLVINVSSPNTVGIRELQGRHYLTNLVSSVVDVTKSKGKSMPVLVKVSPDNSLSELEEIVEVCLESKISGIVATNTSTDHSLIRTNSKELKGGVSGAPIFCKSLDVVRKVAEMTSGTEVSVVGCGGVCSYETYMKMREAGADLVEMYTGIIYEGPTLINRILNSCECKLSVES